MPALAISTRRARYSILQVQVPEQGVVNAGVLLEDPESDRLYVRLRRDTEALGDEEEREVFDVLADDLTAKAGELGAARLLEYLESTLSGTLRITDREAVVVEDFERALGRLYRKHVPSTVLKFETHLPRYSLRAAAGKFLENEEISEQGWIEAPAGLRLTPEMFVAEIAGHSMEPLIPDRALCVFRAGVAGSRQGRLLLVEDRTTSGDNRYAVKRYRSEKVESGSEWRHAHIRLESLNPEYPSWDLDPEEEKYRIVAEFVRVLD